MIHFTKLHGNGNDFILIDEYSKKIMDETSRADFAKKYCHRRFGIGADGLLFLSRSDIADVRMRIYNSDGTEAEMCGNAIRCLTKYALDRGYANERASVETQAGILSTNSRYENGTWISVNMGKPQFERNRIPAKGMGEFFNVLLHGYKVSAVNIGVPHAVIAVDSLDDPDLMKTAPEIRYDPIFPNGANVNFMKVISPDEIMIRTFERGVEGETWSCGTGSVACAAIANRLGKTGNKVIVNTKGGELRIALSEEAAYMEGRAEEVFEGTIPGTFSIK